MVFWSFFFQWKFDDCCQNCHICNPCCILSIFQLVKDESLTLKLQSWCWHLTWICPLCLSHGFNPLRCYIQPHVSPSPHRTRPLSASVWEPAWFSSSDCFVTRLMNDNQTCQLSLFNCGLIRLWKIMVITTSGEGLVWILSKCCIELNPGAPAWIRTPREPWWRTHTHTHTRRPPKWEKALRLDDALFHALSLTHSLSSITLPHTLCYNILPFSSSPPLSPITAPQRSLP